MSKSISLTQGKEATVDDYDFDAIGSHKWFANQIYKGKWYAVRSVRQNGKGKTILMHREIMGNPSGMEIDHIDGNPLNNQRSNLRLSTRRQNAANAGVRSHNKSGFKGVIWEGRARKWRASIVVKQKFNFLGYFEDKSDAAKTYDAAALREYGEFALTNQKLGLI